MPFAVALFRLNFYFSEVYVRIRKPAATFLGSPEVTIKWKNQTLLVTVAKACLKSCSL